MTEQDNLQNIVTNKYKITYFPGSPGTVNVRNSPSLNANIIGNLRYGDIIDVCAIVKHDKWVQFIYQGTTGYIILLWDNYIMAKPINISSNVMVKQVDVTPLSAMKHISSGLEKLLNIKTWICLTTKQQNHILMNEITDAKYYQVIINTFKNLSLICVTLYDPLDNSKTSKSIYTINLDTLNPTRNSDIKKELPQELKTYIKNNIKLDTIVDCHMEFNEYISEQNNKNSDFYKNHNTLRIISFNMQLKKNIDNEQIEQLILLDADLMFLCECHNDIEFKNYIEIISNRSHSGKMGIFINKKIIKRRNYMLQTKIGDDAFALALIKTIYGKFVCGVMHLKPTKNNHVIREQTIGQISEWVNQFNYPCIIGGDTNMRNFENDIIKKYGFDDIYMTCENKNYYATWPNRNYNDHYSFVKIDDVSDNYRFDRFMIKKCNTARFRTINTGNSDHLMIAVDVTDIAKKIESVSIDKPNKSKRDKINNSKDELIPKTLIDIDSIDINSIDIHELNNYDDNMIYYNNLYLNLTVNNYFKRLEIMTDVMDKRDYEAMDDLNLTHRHDVKARIHKYIKQLTMLDAGLYPGVNEYTFHTSKIIINKADMLYMGQKLGYNFWNALSEYEQYINLCEFEQYMNAATRDKYDIVYTINGYGYINFYRDKKLSHQIDLLNIKSEKISKKFIKLMNDRYIERNNLYPIEILNPILEYGISETLSRGVFTFMPVQQQKTANDVKHCWNLFQRNINDCYNQGLYRKIIMGKDHRDKYVFYLITTTVNNIENLRELYTIDCCHACRSKPLIPYCKIKYVNHDKSFSKTFRCPSMRETKSGIICLF